MSGEPLFAQGKALYAHFMNGAPYVLVSKPGGEVVSACHP